MNLIVRFDQAGSDNKSMVGGKGANLGLCTQAGLPVPPGFTIAVDAYATFMKESGLERNIVSALKGANYADTADIEGRTAQVRKSIESTKMSQELAREIAAAYDALGQDIRVAVRSSGTSEDLAEASFAGMHDTYLNVCGADAVADAVKACWASLWTERAVIYRQKKGITDLGEIRMAVVVQMMVDSEVSGVMFTASPISTATDEVVINASWGLGELIVQGSVTPDEFIVKVVRPLAVGFDRLHSGGAGASPTLKVKARSLGTKEQRMVRAERGQGSVIQDVPEQDRARFSLSDEQVLELAELGRRVQVYYDQMPQDIEWGFSGGKFYLLQARPITGVAFDWAADMESFQWAPDDENALWTAQLALLVTGAKSPLYYHWVSDADCSGYYAIGNALGILELMGPSYYTNSDADLRRSARHQIHKFHRGEVYLNGEVEKLIVERTYLPLLRTPEITPFLPPQYAQEAHAKPFSYTDFVKSYAQLMLVAPESGLFRVLDRIQKFIDVDMAGEQYDPTKLQFKTLSDSALRQALNDSWLAAAKYTGWSMVLWFVYWQQMSTLFAKMLQWWYDGDNKDAYAQLCQGLNSRSKTVEENLRLFEFAETIRGSERLKKLFAEHKGQAFFKALEDSAEGRELLERYREFVREHGHRGHEDRDFGYPRRFEDSAVDYRSLGVLLSRDHHESPYEIEEKLNQRRAAVLDDVLNNLRRTPFIGHLKAEAIRLVHNWVLRFILLRDDERWAYERTSLCAKLYCREIGRRLVERGLLENQEDFLMFTKDELFDLLDGRMGKKLARAKAVARRRDYDRALERTQEYPMLMRDGREVAAPRAEGEGGLVGTGWTSGTITATARVVSRLIEIDRVKQGEILVCQSTDPGWTPVFMLLSGIVVETGGVLSHAVCLSREYGLPAIQLRGARKLIPDGATITINGATGEVVIVEAPSVTNLLAA